MKVLITGGGTIAPIDDVRYITNMSTGRFATEIGFEVLRRGWPLSFIHSKYGRAPHLLTLDLRKDVDDNIELLEDMSCFDQEYYHSIEYKTVSDYRNAVLGRIREWTPDVVFLAAAVSDYIPDPQPGKISSDLGEMAITLRRTTKVINEVRLAAPHALLVGFKLLSGSLSAEHAAIAMKQMDVLNGAGSDVVVVNDISDIRKGEHRLWVYSEDGMTEITGPTLSKHLVKHVSALKGKKSK